ncbi:ABC transporter permease [Actinacidiphila glaucinigra]|uniref:ABC-2 type transport system permease protein n=1 Tax=Actinacidiphila glaucinigra TaxID=235986 RepID=A0A239EW23_9ACTN|nr:ABC transporter permease [Actinacidiphila glaucinigra]SNS48024.1 ABC-2 type transport system permease protein [Actinacidiphila glaucinigra]
MRTLARLEILRVLRNRKFMFFSVLYPVLLFMILTAGQKAAMVPYYMVAMCAFGAMTAVLMGNSERIARERDKGWVRQLRLTALPGRGYVLAKVAAAATVSLPSILLVLLAGGAVKGVRMAAWQWAGVLLTSWAGSFVFAALGVAIGYVASAETARPVAMIAYFGLALLGGLWVPFDSFPGWLRDIANLLPARPYAALGQAVESGRAPHAGDVAVLVVYGLVFAATAAWMYRKDTAKA